MEFIKERFGKSEIISEKVMESTGWKEGERLEMNVGDSAGVITKQAMNAMELIQGIETLKNFADTLILTLAKECGSCNDCGACFDRFYDIKVPEYLLEEAGIPEGAKLCAYAEENSGEIKVKKADYKYDLSDVPEYILRIFDAAGVCVGKLEELLMLGVNVYGKDEIIA